MTRPARAIVHLAALRHNLRRVRQSAPRCRVLAVVKANGYGHGAVRVARALSDAEGFAVAGIDEALELREAGVDARILLLSGVHAGEALERACRYRLDVVVHHESQLEMLERARLEHPLEVWLKIDSGMHRLGVPPEQARSFWERLHACPQVDAHVRTMTHLANADDRRDPTTRRQLETFRDATRDLDGERSIANSGGVLGWPDTQADWVRPGIMLYGISPFVGGTAANEGLEPGMTLTTRLIAVNRVPRGGAVGYGGTWVCPEDMPVGVAAIGYGDGYLRHLPSGTPVLVNGRRVPLVGRVSMDLITVDLRTQPQARPGDEVVLWGRGLPVEEIAEHAGTIPYELVCRVAQRVLIDTEEI
ncbi:MAG: alanine racemase [Gammaproteobacteria bacterium]|nr:alanine racemase [Gammaproteobacteria bacterium]NIR84751.1 alanine racemase [Gammaproteobacteria bacterium]NIR91247.1 alanine racemase [Gammaproteobacteria bacterium]NIU05794.1 alanine racemase [Gammaproteobacteria bacterium]NIV52913.1 alanine racemase [Gammaproteobacteria bacterium]